MRDVVSSTINRFSGWISSKPHADTGTLLSNSLGPNVVSPSVAKSSIFRGKTFCKHRNPV